MKFIENIFSEYKGGKLGLSGLTDELLCVYLNKIYTNNKQDIVIVTSTLFEANKIYQILIKFTNNVLFFPMDDFLTSEALAISPNLKINRLETIADIIKNKHPNIIVTHLMGFLRYLPSKDLFHRRIIKIKEGEEIKKENLVRSLYELGYNRETIVTQIGDFGERGFVVDIFPITEENPVRIEFWGDAIESIKYFDLNTQRSINKIKEINIYPFSEFLIPKSAESIIKKQKYLSIYSDEIVNISNYLNKPIVVYKDYQQIINANLQLREEILNYKQNNKEELETNYMFELEKLNYTNEIYINVEKRNAPKIAIDSFELYNSKPIIIYQQSINIKQQLNKMLTQGKTIIIYVTTDAQINNLENVLGRNFVITNENNINKKCINIIKRDIMACYMIENYIVLSYANLFNDATNNVIYHSKYKYGNKIKNINKLKIGDYVVHNINGIGVYAGIATLNKKGIKKDYLQIKYRNNDKLYIPVEKIDLIYKYSSQDGVKPRIDKLGGTDWQKTKARVRGKLIDMAKELLLTSALRKMTKGFAYAPDDENQVIFESEFIFNETEDQKKAIEEIKNDMESNETMDRLLCGDVGFGKTEVAFRTAFKAINNNKQVAYLCPTTILSHQHYINAIERFKNFPIKIELLNRFVSSNKTKEIINELKKGTIDLIIGTHRLLSKDISFKDLGLLIIDEEQRFGVIHKEKIKKYKTGIDVLTLSATPIPRTLQLSMAGIKGLSVIETPPANRFPVQTYVLEYNEYLIKDAIYKELSRKGQIFFLYNRVANILERVNLLKRIVPEAQITYIHGKMAKQQIEAEMIKFINGEYDILVCTTIIETGIDIPNVNTLIVIDADRFGLSQLYQIRGRVGRSNKIAYAYLMYQKNKVLSEIALKRLNTIKDFTELGSGFDIAVRDLSIRGAGNILGSEQAGFIDAIGIELYMKMLNEEIEYLKGNNIKPIELEREEKPVLNIATYISDEYVNDPDLKIELHRKINEIDSYEKLIEVKNEIEDRFGKVTEDIIIYMYQEWFEKIIPTIGIEKVNQTKEKIELIWSKKATQKLEINKIMTAGSSFSNNFKFQYKNNKFKATLLITNLEKHWLYILLEFLKKVSNF
jgi:transcription-repair coupling factor (superfamily II helicase)